MMPRHIQLVYVWLIRYGLDRLAMKMYKGGTEDARKALEFIQTYRADK
jgi:hypothetical protein